MLINKNGITIKELKELIKDMSEVDKYGEDYEVWIETGKGLSSPVTYAGKLNSRDEGSDLILESNAFKWM
mgnify:CR=1 FL=1